MLRNFQYIYFNNFHPRFIFHIAMTEKFECYAAGLATKLIDLVNV